MAQIYNTNISHQPFDNKITIVNSQHEKPNSEVDFVLKKNCGVNVRLKDFWYRYKNQMLKFTLKLL